MSSTPGKLTIGIECTDFEFSLVKNDILPGMCGAHVSNMALARVSRYFCAVIIPINTRFFDGSTSLYKVLALTFVCVSFLIWFAFILVVLLYLQSSKCNDKYNTRKNPIRTPKTKFKNQKIVSSDEYNFFCLLRCFLVLLKF